MAEKFQNKKPAAALPSWFSNVPRGQASGIIALAVGGEKNKNKNIFLASSQTAPPAP